MPTSTRGHLHAGELTAASAYKGNETAVRWNQLGSQDQVGRAGPRFTIYRRARMSVSPRATSVSANASWAYRIVSSGDGGSAYDGSAYASAVQRGNPVVTGS